MKGRTVEWLSVDASGRERANWHLRRVEEFERQKRVQTLKQERRRVRRPTSHGNRAVRDLVTITLLLVAAIAALSALSQAGG